MAKDTAALLHKHAEAVSKAAAADATASSAGPASPIALLMAGGKDLEKSAKKAAKKDLKRTIEQAKKAAKLELKALKAKAADGVRAGAGRPLAAPLKPKRTGFSAKRTDLVDLSDEEARISTAKRTDLVDLPDEEARISTAKRTDLVDLPDEEARISTAKRTDLVDLPDEEARISTAKRTDFVDLPDEEARISTAKRTDLIDHPDDVAVADAEGAFDTDPDADLDAQAEADAERAARAAAAAETEDDVDVTAEDGDSDDDEFDDEFEALLGRGSFSGKEKNAESFLAPRPKTAAKPTDAAGGDTDSAGGDVAASTEPAAEAAADKASVGELCRHVGTWWRVLTPSAGALTVADLKWLGGRLEPKQWKDLETVAADEHKALLGQLAEQKLDVTDDGVLMHEVAGKREPLPVDDDGNPVAAAAGATADPEARAKALVEFRGGKLFRARTAEGDAVLVDTADSFSADGGAGWENVTVDKAGTFYLTSQPPGADQLDVVDSGDVVMRGQVKVSLGTIGTLSNRADPDPVDGEGLRAALTLLQGQGSGLQFKIVEIVEDVRTTGREFLADAKEAETVAAVTPGVVATLKAVAAWRALADEVGAAELGAIVDERGWRGTGTEIQDENGEPVDPTLARDLLKKELAELEAKKAAAPAPTGKAASATATP